MCALGQFLILSHVGTDAQQRSFGLASEEGYERLIYAEGAVLGQFAVHGLLHVGRQTIAVVALDAQTIVARSQAVDSLTHVEGLVEELRDGRFAFHDGVEASRAVGQCPAIEAACGVVVECVGVVDGSGQVACILLGSVEVVGLYVLGELALQGDDVGLNFGIVGKAVAEELRAEFVQQFLQTGVRAATFVSYQAVVVRHDVLLLQLSSQLQGVLAKCDSLLQTGDGGYAILGSTIVLGIGAFSDGTFYHIECLGGHDVLVADSDGLSLGNEFVDAVVVYVSVVAEVGDAEVVEDDPRAAAGGAYAHGDVAGLGQDDAQRAGVVVVLTVVLVVEVVHGTRHAVGSIEVVEDHVGAPSAAIAVELVLTGAGGQVAQVVGLFAAVAQNCVELCGGVVAVVGAFVLTAPEALAGELVHTRRQVLDGLAEVEGSVIYLAVDAPCAGVGFAHFCQIFGRHGAGAVLAVAIVGAEACAFTGFVDPSVQVARVEAGVGEQDGQVVAGLAVLADVLANDFHKAAVDGGNVLAGEGTLLVALIDFVDEVAQVKVGPLLFQFALLLFQVFNLGTQHLVLADREGQLVAGVVQRVDGGLVFFGVLGIFHGYGVCFLHVLVGAHLVHVGAEAGLVLCDAIVEGQLHWVFLYRTVVVHVDIVDTEPAGHHRLGVLDTDAQGVAINEDDAARGVFVEVAVVAVVGHQCIHRADGGLAVDTARGFEGAGHAVHRVPHAGRQGVATCGQTGDFLIVVKLAVGSRSVPVLNVVGTVHPRVTAVGGHDGPSGEAAVDAVEEFGVVDDGSDVGRIFGRGRIDAVLAIVEDDSHAGVPDEVAQFGLSLEQGIEVVALVHRVVGTVLHVQAFLFDGHGQCVEVFLGKVDRVVHKIPVAEVAVLGVNLGVYGEGLSRGVVVAAPAPALVGPAVHGSLAEGCIGGGHADVVEAVLLLQELEVAVYVGGVVHVHGKAFDVVAGYEDVVVGPCAVVALHGPAQGVTFLVEVFFEREADGLAGFGVDEHGGGVPAEPSRTASQGEVRLGIHHLVDMPRNGVAGLRRCGGLGPRLCIHADGHESHGKQRE